MQCVSLYSAQYFHFDTWQMITGTRAAVNDAHCALIDRRDDFAAAMPCISDVNGSESAAHALDTLDATINTFANLGDDLAAFAKQTGEKF